MVAAAAVVAGRRAATERVDEQGGAWRPPPRARRLEGRASEFSVRQSKGGCEFGQGVSRETRAAPRSLCVRGLSSSGCDGMRRWSVDAMWQGLGRGDRGGQGEAARQGGKSGADGARAAPPPPPSTRPPFSPRPRAIALARTHTHKHSKKHERSQSSPQQPPAQAHARRSSRRAREEARKQKKVKRKPTMVLLGVTPPPGGDRLGERRGKARRVAPRPSCARARHAARLIASRRCVPARARAHRKAGREGGREGGRR